MRSLHRTERRQIVSAIFALILALFISSPEANAQRDPVLKQVSVPHSYYWREMYIPQLTSGPGGLAWSRDGKGLVYSMQGRLWRQKTGSGTAEQITSGAGYDYQPDVSPDGRRVVFARYLNDAIELVIRDLRSGKEIAVTSVGAVNVDPRWSPDGEKIAYVTTAESGKFHIAIAEKRDGAWTSRRWRPERTSAIPRYYYSQVDHELSPAWTPDGASLIFVANPENGYGTGAIFRQPLDLSSAAIEIRREETTWKARPDVSPDGRRVAYSSYLGRQWHQLWATTADGGGYPIPLSYGDFDITSARWSPDGSRLAYISNESGDGVIWIQDAVGGARRAIAIGRKKYAQPMGTLDFEIKDADGALSPARVAIRASDGRDYAPNVAMIHADDSYDRAWGPSETHYFHTDGQGAVALPAGEATIRVWRGLGATPQTRIVEIRKGERARIAISLAGIDEAGAFTGWVSGDVHVHMNYGGAYRMTPERLAGQAAAEDLDLVFNLLVNKEQRIPDIAYFSTKPARPAGPAIIAAAQEFHTSIWGHLGLIGLDDHFLLGDYSGYPGTAAYSLYPDNTAIADLAHAQSALVGYVHPFDPPPPDPFADQKLTFAFPVEIALGKIDYVEVIGFSDHRITEEIWERLLNCGFRIPAAGGTDAMSNFASLRGPVGLNRTYVKLDDPPADPQSLMRDWLAGLKAGRSFATNGPMIGLEVAGAGPGAELRLKRGQKLGYKVKMASIAPVDALELIVNGEVAASIPLGAGGMSAEYAGEVEISKSGWIALRASSREASPDVFDLHPFAVTTPVYVIVDGKPARSRPDANFFIAWIEKLEGFAQASDAYNSDDERKAVLAHLKKARTEFERRR